MNKAAPVLKQETSAGGEYPSQDQLKALGDLCFVMMRAPDLAQQSLQALRAMIEPAVDTGHFAILRRDDVPRAAITFAYLDEDAEERLLAGAFLSTQDWISGSRLWLMDVVAPYGQGTAARMIRFWHQSLGPEVSEYHCIRRAKSQGQARRYMVRRMANGKFGSRMTIHQQKQMQQE
ncbi:MAG: toxin-activating lysine-acyltransferase [Pseudomonadota bacterium]